MCVNNNCLSKLHFTSSSDASFVSLFRYSRMVSIKEKGESADLEINPNGTLKYVELEVMNLNNMGFWEKVTEFCRNNNPGFCFT
ncbi:hypothetical protein AVEN_170649-1 [Araneus ventricosus]|uniref:Uncharacterized protein n=1 Tax=Araneus ventricosus TaxID=182803 RepID=A0A4Y2GZ03_ARAVE|nr:hypothetical protein AVEN_170649-1 [Araneus ventricosus]